MSWDDPEDSVHEPRDELVDEGLQEANALGEPLCEELLHECVSSLGNRQRALDDELAWPDKPTPDDKP
ncbi:hypothetical protein [Pseudomonas sp. R5(2019)]|uniref:hypothetical protein n=1 Tax=Pseudomonas sp. R5(2019) TaxID=2697566 RepID=UPI001412BD7A|nr:hypothetical protein [Pseudomonas sp. R5(2019)]NBA96597.1 hypothetical protein [Pseudomonas sp. R5(2019)]